MLGKVGMCWERLGEIDIDHCIPVEYPGAAGGKPTLDEKVARLHYRNCQPLWSRDNRLKGNRWADPQPKPEPQQEYLTDAELAEVLGFD